MSENLNENSVNQIQKDTVIYRIDEPFTSVGLVLKGRIIVETDGMRTILSSGNFLGVCDIGRDAHSFTYTAYDNSVVFIFSIKSQKDLEGVLQKNPEYYGLLNTSLNFFILEMHRTYVNLGKQCVSIREFIYQQYEEYQKAGKEAGIDTEYIGAIDTLKKETKEEFPLDKHIPYYVASSSIPVVAQKNFYMGNPFVSMYHFRQQRVCIDSLLKGLSYYSKEMLRSFRVMISDEKSLFALISGMAMNLGYMKKDNKAQVAATDELIQKINEIETLLVDKLGQKVSANRAKMEKIYFSLLSGEIPKEVDLDLGDSVSDLENSLQQILDYTTIDSEIKEGFLKKFNAFLSLPKKFSKEDEAVKVRRNVGKNFYDIYEPVFMKSLEDSNPPLAVKLFLNYGYMCEDLLTEEQLKELLLLQPKDDYKEGSRVYSMPEWLTAVYKMKKQPSKNEFDQDFEEYLRQEKKERRISPEEEKKLMTDPKARVHYEIQNMFRYANRVLHGKATSFLPVLCSEAFSTVMSSSFLTADRINAQIAQIEAVDFSIFYREKVVFYEEIGAIKDTVVEKYYPDIILFPIIGQNSLMWQDIIGKKRTTKGRFFFPVFLEPSLENEVLKVMGEFRWEICRTEQGMHWNDVRYPSLVSEYTDYLQFYRKNALLSSESKEKVKSQLTKNSNRHRSVFAKDYTEWVTREAKGGIRVNKVARTILATYCPFRKDIRVRTNEQPMNAEAGKRFIIQRMKQLKQTEGTCSRFDKAGIPIPKELEETREYLKNT